MKRYYLLLIAIAFGISTSAQDVIQSAKKVQKNYVSSEYDRNAMTLIGLDFSESHSGEVLNHFFEMSVPEKYYDNSVSPKILKIPDGRESFGNKMKVLSNEKVIQLLNDNKVGQKILSVWFNQQPDGSFNVESLKKRGLFNANDDDLIIAEASKRGQSALMDMGLPLVNKSYVAVFDFPEISTMAEYYIANEIPVKNRPLNGYKAVVHEYLYKLDFNEAVAAEFFQKYWVSANDPDKAAKVEAFQNATFPFIAVNNVMRNVQGTQFNAGQPLAPKVQKTKDELLSMLTEISMEKVFTVVENQNADFRVKAMVNQVRPIGAKIGTKEGLKFDQRYFVYENVSKRNGNIVSKRRAVVKSMKVVNNSTVTSGETESSLFYQIAGGKVDNYGMFLEQKNDAGVNLCLNYAAKGFEGPSARLEYYISRQLYDVVAKGKNASALTSVKMYAEAGFNEKTYFTGTDSEDDYSFTGFSAGLAKDFYAFNFAFSELFVGYGIESATRTNSEHKLSTDFIEYGVRIGVNLTPGIQLMGSVGSKSILTSKELDEDGAEFNTEFDYFGEFIDRKGQTLSFGLRFMF